MANLTDYRDFTGFGDNRRSFATAELPEEGVEAISTSRMDPRHAHLDKLLDPNIGGANATTTASCRRDFSIRCSMPSSTGIKPAYAASLRASEL